VFGPAKNVAFFHSKLLLDNSASFSSSTCVKKWKVKLIFEAPTGCQEPGLLSVWRWYGIVEFNVPLDTV